MKTNYTSLSPKRRRRLGPRALLTFAVVALVIVAAVFWRGPLSAVLWHVLTPVVSLRNSFGATAAAEARDKLARAEATMADHTALLSEVAALKKMLGREAPASERVLASVLQRPPSVPYDTLLLDVGARHGVVVGALVYAGGSVVLGEVTEVRDGSATATLYSSPGRELPALLLHGGQSTPLTLAGQGAGSFIAQLPAGVAAAVGDTIVFAGIVGEIPATVSAVVQKQGESFMQVYLHLPVNLFELRYVEVAL